MFKIVADEIWYNGEVFAKITMPLSISRDNAENQIEIANADLDDSDSVDELVQKAKADARIDALDDAESSVLDLIQELYEKTKEKFQML